MDVQCILLLSFIIDFSAWPIDRCERRRLEAHGDGVKHREAAHQLPLEKGQKKLASIPPSQLFTDDGLWIRLSSVHYLAVEDVAIHKFRSTIDLQLVNNGFSPSKHYHDDAAAWEMATIISQHQRKLLKEQLAKSPYFGIMVDETTDTSTTQQLILYIKYLNWIEDSEQQAFHVTVEYLDLVSPANGTAEGITVTLTSVKADK